MDEYITIEGYVEDIIYNNSENGYSVFKLSYKNMKLTCVGTILEVKPGELLELIGNWVSHKKFGKQFSFKEVKRQLPNSENAMVKYLSSGFIKGIGEKTAIKIINHFGSDITYVLENDPMRLSEIKGISQQKAIEIKETMQQQKNLSSVVMFFSKYGISINTALKAYKLLGEETLDLIKKNPYRLCDELIGLSFKKADMIASSEQLEFDSSERITSGLIYILRKALSQGHTFLKIDNLVKHSSQLLKVNPELIRYELKETINNGMLVNNSECIYIPKYYDSEKYVADRIRSLKEIDYSSNKKLAESSFKKVLENMNIEIDSIQQQAVNTALYKGISVISGGPGTGKTTIIKVLIDTLFMMGVKFLLAAPTGRAAKKMEEYSVFESKTIHRLLEVEVISSTNESIFNRNEYNPLECDVLIIDEVSMVDILLMQALLKALPIGGRIVLLGDSNQLPAVGPGLVLQDIIESEIVHCTLLNKIYRQGEFSKIPELSQNIINGIITQDYNYKNEINLIECKDDSQSIKTIETIYNEHIINKTDIQIISPSKKGMLGTDNLNKYMQDKINSKHFTKNEKIFSTGIFREHDKVMQIKNNYDLYYRSAKGEGYGIYNGDIGVIKEINNEKKYLKVMFEGEKLVEYEFSECNQIELAYCITVHKSQGSEYDCIIIPLYYAYEALLNRNLLYTAITRAKKRIYLIGDKNVITKMINNKDTNRRYSGLVDMLLEK